MNNKRFDDYLKMRCCSTINKKTFIHYAIKLIIFEGLCKKEKLIVIMPAYFSKTLKFYINNIMKMTFIILFILLSVSVKCQKINNYNTKIDNAGNVNINNGNVMIGKIIINNSEKHSLYYYKTEINKGIRGIDTSSFFFTNPDDAPSYNINMEIQFSEAVDTAYFNFYRKDTTVKAIAWGTSWGLSLDKKILRIVINQLNPGTGLKIVYVGKKNIIPIITGVEGK